MTLSVHLGVSVIVPPNASASRPFAPRTFTVNDSGKMISKVVASW